MAKVPTYKRQPQKSSGTVKLSGSSGAGQGLASLGQQFQEAGQVMHKYAQKKKKQKLRDEQSDYTAHLDTMSGKIVGIAREKTRSGEFSKEDAKEYVTAQIAKMDKAYRGKNKYSEDGLALADRQYEQKLASTKGNIDTEQGPIGVALRANRRHEEQLQLDAFEAKQNNIFSDAEQFVKQGVDDGSIAPEDAISAFHEFVTKRFNKHMKGAKYSERITSMIKVAQKLRLSRRETLMKRAEGTPEGEIRKVKKQKEAEATSTYNENHKTADADLRSELRESFKNGDKTKKEIRNEYEEEMLERHDKWIQELEKKGYDDDVIDKLDRDGKSSITAVVNSLKVEGRENFARALEVVEGKQRGKDVQDFLTWRRDEIASVLKRAGEMAKDGSYTAKDIANSYDAGAAEVLEKYLEDHDFDDDTEERIRREHEERTSKITGAIRAGENPVAVVQQETKKREQRKVRRGNTAVWTWYIREKGKLTAKSNRWLEADPLALNTVADDFGEAIVNKLANHLENANYSEEVLSQRVLDIAADIASTVAAIRTQGQTVAGKAREVAEEQERRTLEDEKRQHESYFDIEGSAYLEVQLKLLDRGIITEEEAADNYAKRMHTLNEKFIAENNYTEEGKRAARAYLLSRETYLRTHLQGVPVGEAPGEINKILEKHKRQEVTEAIGAVKGFFVRTESAILEEMEVPLRSGKMTSTEGVLKLNKELQASLEKYLDEQHYPMDVQNAARNEFTNLRNKAIQEFGRNHSDIPGMVTEGYEARLNKYKEQSTEQSRSVREQIAKELEDGTLDPDDKEERFVELFNKKNKGSIERIDDPLTEYRARRWRDEYLEGVRDIWAPSFQDIEVIEDNLKEVENLGIVAGYENGFEEKLAGVKEFAFGVTEHPVAGVSLNVPVGDRKAYIIKEMNKYLKEADLDGLSKAEKGRLKIWHESRADEEAQKAVATDRKARLSKATAALEGKLKRCLVNFYGAQRAGDEKAIEKWRGKREEAYDQLKKAVGSEKAKKSLKRGYLSHAENSIERAGNVSAVHRAWGNVNGNLLSPKEVNDLRMKAENRISELEDETLGYIKEALKRHKDGEDIRPLIPELNRLAIANLGKVRAFPVKQALESLYSKSVKISELTQDQQDVATDAANAEIGNFLGANDPEDQREVLAKLIKSSAIGESAKVFLIGKMLDETDTKQGGWPGKGAKDKNGFNYLRGLYLTMAKWAGTTEVYSDFFETWERLEAIQDDGYENFLPEDEDFQRLSDQEKAVRVIDELVGAKKNKIFEGKVFAAKLDIFNSTAPLPQGEELWYPGTRRDGTYDSTERAMGDGGIKESDRGEPAAEEEEDESFFGVGKFGPLDIRDVPSAFGIFQ